MNPSLKLALVLLISLEVSFTQKLGINLILVMIGLILVLKTRPSGLTLVRLIAIPAIPAATLAITIGAFSPGHDWFFAGVLASRIYVYVFLGSAVTLATTPLELAKIATFQLNSPMEPWPPLTWFPGSLTRLKPSGQRDKCGAWPFPFGHPNCISRQF